MTWRSPGGIGAGGGGAGLVLPLPFASYTPAPQPHCMTKVPGREDPPGAGWAGGTGGVEGRAGGGV